MNKERYIDLIKNLFVDSNLKDYVKEYYFNNITNFNKLYINSKRVDSNNRNKTIFKNIHEELMFNLEELSFVKLTIFSNERNFFIKSLSLEVKFILYDLMRIDVEKIDDILLTEEERDKKILSGRY